MEDISEFNHINSLYRFALPDVLMFENFKTIIIKIRRFMENILQGPKTFKFLHQKQAMSRNVLYADNEKPMQTIILKVLKRMGFEVVLADNGVEALSLFIEGYFNIVITDYRMPFMDGLILATNIKNRSPETPIILLTDCDSEDVIDKLERGKSLFYSIIFKPFRMNELRNAIEGALKY